MMRNYRILAVVGVIGLTALACLGGASVATPVVEPTSALQLDLEELARQTEVALNPPTATLSPTATLLPPTLTMEATATPQIMVMDSAPQGATATAAPTDARIELVWGDRYFVVQQGTPVEMPNWAHPDLGCNWMGIGGQVFDLNGSPALNMVVEAGGTLEGQPVLGLTLTGLTSVYGPGGYEIQLADHVAASVDEVWVQIKDDAGRALSEPVFLDTFTSCEQNLIILNFVEQAGPPPPATTMRIFLPLIGRGRGAP